MHTHTQTHIHTYTHIHTHTFTHTYIHTHIQRRKYFRLFLPQTTITQKDSFVCCRKKQKEIERERKKEKYKHEQHSKLQATDQAPLNINNKHTQTHTSTHITQHTHTPIGGALYSTACPLISADRFVVLFGSDIELCLMCFLLKSSLPIRLNGVG